MNIANAIIAYSNKAIATEEAVTWNIANTNEEISKGIINPEALTNIPIKGINKPNTIIISKITKAVWFSMMPNALSKTGLKPNAIVLGVATARLGTSTILAPA